MNALIDHGCSCGRPACRYDEYYGNQMREIDEAFAAAHAPRFPRTKRSLRCTRAIPHLFHGPLNIRRLAIPYGRIWDGVLRCYDQGIANGPPGNHWDRWAAACRGESDLYVASLTKDPA